MTLPSSNYEFWTLDKLWTFSFCNVFVSSSPCLKEELEAHQLRQHEGSILRIVCDLHALLRFEAMIRPDCVHL
ncbi:uncharacterized protein PHALS_05095 [Plasmopara halstedii]|uniref:Uncharacterized protein n=1 Tax=Plasmopara halstedii TaxID=4781 RepID=A0A0P1B2U5_PLAHL|nr:uncharacterized protein PHALS_05095 [Plasmopara halstedii]CEG47759.1 hypothetical protein PHALS_05095 [Plasmopara halstedii]|eukprot:XP_024584128.1 hypothetical protein PHALS_05095 [Plasmopara halstedii]